MSLAFHETKTSIVINYKWRKVKVVFRRRHWQNAVQQFTHNVWNCKVLVRDSYCTNRHLGVRQHDSCMFVRKCALEAGKLSISCCIYSTAQCSRDLSVTLLYRASVKSVMQHTVAALADISMTKTIPTYPRLGCLDIKRTFRLKKTDLYILNHYS